MSSETEPILEARDISKTFPGPLRLREGRPVRARAGALKNVNLSLFSGETVALVGESGSGKSTLARTLARLERPSGGTVLLRGRPVAGGLREYTRCVQLVLQDPFASLNPVHTVGYTISRPIRLAPGGWRLAGGEVRSRIAQALERVQLTPVDQFIEKYPHELSGGQRQRVSIARALAADPDVLLADEPISMLDVSIRLGILNLLKDIQTERNIALLYITHDIATARYFADRAVVMYAGEAVETGPVDDVILRPRHPYTQMLVQAAPRPGRARDADDQSKGEPPSLVNPPSGCRFHPRCPFAMDVCRSDAPPMAAVSDGHRSKCWLNVTPAL